MLDSADEAVANSTKAEGVGFEPTMGCPIAVFKTAAIGL
jgi:hypothetical protein